MKNTAEKLPKIRVNQLGYAPKLPKDVVVTEDGTYVLTDASGAVVRRFEAIRTKEDIASGDRVATISLGELEPGQYTISGGGESRVIAVREHPFGEATGALIKGLYYQRCDELSERCAGRWKHAACHTAPVTEWGSRGESPRRVAGGWHDAGDYGKYVGPGAVTVGHLLYTWKLFPEACGEELNIPESGNGVPDILNEARFELEWILRMQRADGAFYHKLTTARFSGFIMPEEDLEPEYLIPPSHCATGAAVAALALAKRVYEPYDAAFAERCLAAATRGWKWLCDNPDNIPFRNPEGVQTGWYSDFSDRDERFWAACELYAATCDEAFREEAETLYREVRKLTQFGWMEVSGLGALCCLFDLGELGGAVLYDDLREAFLRRSEWALLNVKSSGYGTAVPATGYIWGSILTVMSNAMAMIVNTMLTGREDMLRGALAQLDYAFGRNALDLSFVTGFGERTVRFPHHRPSAADGIDDPVPGLISGGPNKKFTYPWVKERLGDTPAAKYFLDETPSADTNEIAIYWNSPTIFTAAYFHSLTLR